LALRARAGRACEIASWYRPQCRIARNCLQLRRLHVGRGLSFALPEVGPRQSDKWLTRPRSALTGVPRVQTLIGRFALGAGSVALSQTFDLGGQTVVLGGQTRGCVHEPAQGALSAGNCRLGNPATPSGPRSRAFTRLAQVQEPGGTSREARGGGGLGKMKDRDLCQLGAPAGRSTQRE
jgi:hypothetical protein